MLDGRRHLSPRTPEELAMLDGRRHSSPRTPKELAMLDGRRHPSPRTPEELAKLDGRRHSSPRTPKELAKLDGRRQKKYIAGPERPIGSKIIKASVSPVVEFWTRKKYKIPRISKSLVNSLIEGTKTFLFGNYAFLRH